jgi:hypothetical protein
MTTNKRKSNKLIAVLVAVLMVATSSLSMVSYGAETVPGEKSPTVTSIGSVDVNLVEDDNSTNKTVTFKGGDISASTAPTVEGGTYTGAYILLEGDKAKSYPISWLGTVNGDVRYMIDSGSTNSINENGLTVTSVKNGNDVIAFEYTMDAAKQNKITYSVTGLTNEDMTALGGHAAVTKGPDTISDGQIVYFQVTRAPGTKITVSTNNGSLSKTATSASGRIETYKLSGTTGAVTITIKEEWQQTSYSMNFKTSTTAKSEGGKWNGRFVIRGIYKNGSLTGNSSVELSGDGTFSSNYYKVEATDSNIGANTVNNTTSFNKNATVASTTFKYNYVLNTIANYNEGTGVGWHHVVNSVVISTGASDDTSEIVAVPDNVQGASKTTTLQYGEKAGTKVTVTCVNSSESGCDGGSIPAYSIEFSNVHTDLVTNWSYVPTSQSYLFIKELFGVDAQIYWKSDTDSIGDRWGDITSGGYTYGKYVPSTGFKVRWKNKAGYDSSVLSVTNINGTTTTYDSSSSSVTKGTDGYYYYALTGLAFNGDPGVKVSISATTSQYKMAYDANNGTYTVAPSDNTVYDVINKSVVLIDKSYPKRAGYSFLGYKIDGNKVDHTFWPGETITLDDTSQVDLSSLATSGGYKTIKLVAQWEELSSDNETSPVVVTVKRQQEDGTYSTTTSTVYAAVNSNYRVMGYADTDNGLDLYSTENISGNVGKENIAATITYKKPASITYTDNPSYNNANDDTIGTYSGTLPGATSSYAYNKVKAASESEGSNSYKFTKDSIKIGSEKTKETSTDTATTVTYTDTYKTFTHSGWIVVSSAAAQAKVAAQAEASDTTTYDFGADIDVPWEGLTLAPNFTEGETTVDRVLTLEASNFEMDMATAGKYDGQSSIDPASDLGKALISLAKAKASVKVGDGNATEESITAISSTIGKTSGNYTVTFTSNSGVTREVTATVLGETIEASDFSVNLGDVPESGLTSDTIKTQSGATAYTGSNKNNTLELTVGGDTVAKESGDYTVSLTTANGTTTNITVTVKTETITAKNFEIDLSSVPTDGISSTNILSMSEAKAYNGNDKDDTISSLAVKSVGGDTKVTTVPKTAGEYKVVLATASGTTKEITVKVLDDTENITASNFTLKFSDFNSDGKVSDEDIIKAAGANAYVSKDPDTSLDLTVSSPNLEKKAGEYDVTFATKAGTSKTVKATVLGETIKANDFEIDISKVDEGGISSGDILSKSEATAYNGSDEKDTISTLAVKAVGGDTTKTTVPKTAGVYTVTLTTGNGTDKDITVTVLDDTEYINASDFTLKFSDFDKDGKVSDKDLIAKAKAGAYVGKAPNTALDLIVNSSSLEKKADEYDVTFTTNAGTSKTVKATVLKENISAEDISYKLSAVPENGVSSNDILSDSKARAWNGNDEGDSIDTLKVKSVVKKTETDEPAGAAEDEPATVVPKTAGAYTVTLTTGNGTDKDITATVIDDTEYVDANDFKVDIDDIDADTGIVEEKIIELAKATAWVGTDEDDTLTLSVKSVVAEGDEDNGDSPKTTIDKKVGTYTVTLTTEKGKTKTITAKVYEYLETINANDFQINIDKVDELTDDDIKDLAEASASTDKDDNLNLTVESKIEKAPGEYEVTFKTDKGNTKTITVTVVENTLNSEGDQQRPSGTDKTGTQGTDKTSKNKSDTAGTFDNFNLFLALGLAALAAAGAGVTVATRRRRG